MFVSIIQMGETTDIVDPCCGNGPDVLHKPELEYLSVVSPSRLQQVNYQAFFLPRINYPEYIQAFA